MDDKITILLPAQIKELSSAPITLANIVSTDFSDKYESLVATIKQLEEIKNSIDEQLKVTIRDQYFDTGEQTLASPRHNFTYVPGSVRETFDTRKFKEENPDLYKQYVKTSAIKESVRVTKKKED